MRERLGFVDPDTGQERGVVARYLSWLQHSVQLDFAAASDDPRRFRQRILSALPVTLLVNVLALLAALAVAIPAGTWLGMRAGSRADRTASTVLLVLFSLPEFVLATVLVLLLAGGLGPALLPAAGLRTEGADGWSLPAQLLDLARHLVLPVVVLAVGPAVWIARLLRESVAAAARSDFVLALRGRGTEPRTITLRVLRHGLSPIATLIASLLPMLVGGSVVVESVFGLPGLGGLTWQAVRGREAPMVMALTMLVSVVTLVGLVLSDVAQRALDPRVGQRLGAPR